MIARAIDNPPAPEALFRRLAHRPWSLWLDSADPRPQTGDWSFVSSDPFGVLMALRGRARWIGADGSERTAEGGLALLEDLLQESAEALGPDDETPLLPFRGGAAGFLAYELGAEIEDLPPPRSRDLDLPDLELAFYDWVLGWNHRTGGCLVISTGLPFSGNAAERRAGDRADEVVRWIRGGPAPGALRGGRLAELWNAISWAPSHGMSDGSASEVGLRSSFTPREYESAVRDSIEKIRAGDIFQVNLSQRFRAPGPEDPVDLYCELRRRAPAPFGAWFASSRGTIASASPERFVSLSATGEMEARPIKGTRPRGKTPDVDRRLADELLLSDKDRSENLMIADLMRNDLSRVATPGTVHVSELFRLESYETVHHLVSVVQGRARAGIGPVDLLRALFPCGSVTGAPKIRAMEVIAELEPVARGPCYGSVGWIGFDGQMDLSVAIRTIVLTRGEAFFHAGGAVVADSDPNGEYHETLDKARALAGSLSFEI
ncbi:MAG: aminodeoxychorismate synthase component I [Gemmatimonadota bacterium]